MKLSGQRQGVGKHPNTSSHSPTRAGSGRKHLSSQQQQTRHTPGRQLQTAVLPGRSTGRSTSSMSVSFASDRDHSVSTSLPLPSKYANNWHTGIGTPFASATATSTGGRSIHYSNTTTGKQHHEQQQQQPQQQQKQQQQLQQQQLQQQQYPHRFSHVHSQDDLSTRGPSSSSQEENPHNNSSLHHSHPHQESIIFEEASSLMHTPYGHSQSQSQSRAAGAGAAAAIPSLHSGAGGGGGGGKPKMAFFRRLE